MKKLIVIAALQLETITSQAALTWHWVNNTPPSGTAISNTLWNSMTSAVNAFNTYSDYSGDILVRYNSAVPAAQTDGYMGWNELFLCAAVKRASDDPDSLSGHPICQYPQNPQKSEQIGRFGPRATHFTRV